MDLVNSEFSISNEQITNPKYLYHYTTYENLQKIITSGIVLQSSKEKAYVHGKGVYLTALAPEVGRHRVFWNNWGGQLPFSTVFLRQSPCPNLNNKTECYLKIEKWSLDSLANINVSRIEDGISQRDSWIYKGDISLDGLHYTVGYVNERGRIIALLNSIHGVNKWSHSIQDLTIECIETETGEFVVSATAKVRLEMKDGGYHEDIGFSSKIGPPSIVAALKAQTKQEAVLDGLKNAAEYFGFPEDFGSPDRSSLANNKNMTPQKAGHLSSSNDSNYQSVIEHQTSMSQKRKRLF